MATVGGARLEVKDGVARILMERAPFNTMTIAFMRRCRELVAEATHNAAVRMLVWESAVPGMFSMGLDPQEILAADIAGRKKIFEELFLLSRAILSAPLPHVAVVNGPAMAGGAVLTGLCDEVIVARDKGKICYSEVKVNLAVPAAISRLAARKVSSAMALEMMALGRNFGADELVAAGYAQAAFEGEGDKERWLAERVEKWRRLDRDVAGETLRGLREDLLGAFETFPASVERFLGEPYLPVGVRLVMEKMR